MQWLESNAELTEQICLTASRFSSVEYTATYIFCKNITEGRGKHVQVHSSELEKKSHEISFA